MQEVLHLMDYLILCVCVCVCVRERERESVCVCERERRRSVIWKPTSGGVFTYLIEYFVPLQTS